MLAGIWLVVGCENSAHNILVELQTKGEVDLPGNTRTTKAGTTSLHLNDGSSDYPGWSL